VKNAFRRFTLILLMFGIYASGQIKKPHLTGRIQYDIVASQTDTSNIWQVASGFRRVHLGLKGRLNNRVDYKAEINIAKGKTSFRDVFIRLRTGWGDFALGSMPEPTGLEMGTSSKFLTFNERSFVSFLQNFRWGSGIHYFNNRLFHHFVYLQLALTGNGTADKGFSDENLTKGLNFTARLSGKINMKQGYAHIGANMALRPYRDLSLKAGNYFGTKYRYLVPGARRNMEWGTEAALTVGPWHIECEYKQRNANRFAFQQPDFEAYYFSTGYFLTGEQRPYKNGVFRRLKPKFPCCLRKNGSGAWELAFRIDRFDVARRIREANETLPGVLMNYALGVNWYMTAHLRMTADFALSRSDQVPHWTRMVLWRMHIDF